MRSTPQNQQNKKQPSSSGLHVVALFEGAKGALVLLAGFELLTFIHKDIHNAAVRLVEHLHLNPTSHYPRIFLDLTEHFSDCQLWAMTLSKIRNLVLNEELMIAE
ncbi:MAG: DUF2127 domain-containing protein [Desulfuromonadaceae bacterium]|nr:DUF2127 domain-containing protein [Desulfuromonadaceae bacterium]